MRYKRDFSLDIYKTLPIKILKGPRQVGKTTLLHALSDYKMVYLDDAATRSIASENPRLFMDSLPNKVVLDEAALVPQLFLELKRRVDEGRRNKQHLPDVWITSSNQTLLRKDVGESLAGRASSFNLNTLSAHELGSDFSVHRYLMHGGWPELNLHPELGYVRYLNDLISTFIEKDVIGTAGIEKRSALIKTIRLLAGRIGQLFDATDIAKSVGVESTTIKSWLSLLELNGILREITPYYTNQNKRLIKSPKWYFEDTGLATRFLGWTDPEPLLASPQFGHLFENMVLGEITRYFVNHGEDPKIHFVRSKEKVEVDFLVDLGNQRWLAIEAKVSPSAYTEAQDKLLLSLNLNIVEKITVTTHSVTSSIVGVDQVYAKISEHSGTLPIKKGSIPLLS